VDRDADGGEEPSVKVLDAGHLYDLDLLDAGIHGSTGHRELRFVKRIGEKFPGNQEPGYEGTTSQEVIRALIDRAQYVDAQKPDVANKLALSNLRSALRWLEVRAAEQRDDDDAAFAILDMEEPETATTCDHCGHVMCRRSHES
jgi:hypothetical protein